MTLQELFIKLSYQYKRQGAQEARQDVDKIDAGVKQTEKSLDRLNAKFDALAVAATAAAVAGTNAYNRLNAAIVEFSGKSGLAIRDFKQFASEANRVARTTGTANESVIEQIQRLYSLGSDQAQASRIARAVSVLESRNVVSGTLAAEAARSMQNVGLGPAMQNLQMTFAAGQTGPGVMQDYFQYAQLLSGVAGEIGGINLDQILGALTVVAAGGKMSTGASGLEEVISQLFRDPEGKRSEFYSQQTGGQWTDMKAMVQEGGLASLIEHIAENFTADELFQLFGSKEAARSIALLMSDPSILRDNIRKINNAANADAIGQFERDTEGEFSVVMKKLNENLEQLLEQFGEPFAKFLSPFLRLLNRLIDGILTLNEHTGGLIAWFAAIGASIFALPRAFRLARGAFGALGSAVDFLKGGDRGGAVSGNKKGGVFDEKSFGAGLASGGIGAAFAWGGAAILRSWKAMMAGLSSFGYQFKTDIQNIRTAFKKGVTPVSVGMHSVADDGTVGKTKHALYRRFLFPVLVMALTPMGKILMGILAAVAIFPALYSKLTDWNARSVLAATRRDAQADHFRAGGARGDEPAPGIADIAAANRAMAVAEKDLLGDELMALVRKRLADIRAMMPNWIVDFVIDPIADLFGWIFGGIHKYISAWGLVIREFFADPRAAISMAWDMAMGKSAEIDSALYTMLIKALGGEPSEDARALGNLVDQSSIDDFKQPTIMLTPEDAAQFGITGDYKKALNAPNLDKISLPTPSSERYPSNKPIAQMEFRMGDINISGAHADDRFELARMVREEAEKALKNSADYIIQEMDFASP